MEIEKLLKILENTTKDFYKNNNIEIDIKLNELEFCNSLDKKEKGTIEINFTIYK